MYFELTKYVTGVPLDNEMMLDKHTYSTVDKANWNLGFDMQVCKPFTDTTSYKCYIRERFTYLLTINTLKHIINMLLNSPPSLCS